MTGKELRQVIGERLADGRQIADADVAALCAHYDLAIVRAEKAEDDADGWIARYDATYRDWCLLAAEVHALTVAIDEVLAYENHSGLAYGPDLDKLAAARNAMIEHGGK